MKVTKICAFPSTIVLYFDQAPDGAEIIVRAQVPLVCGPKDPDFQDGRILSEQTCIIKDGKAVVERYAGEIDLLVYRFLTGCEGVCYVTEVAEEVSAFREPYPTHVMKGITDLHLDGTFLEEDFDYMGFGKFALGPNQAEFLKMHESEDTISYAYNGKTYYFSRSAVAETDETMQRV